MVQHFRCKPMGYDPFFWRIKAHTWYQVGANRRRANAKSSMLQEQHPDAACMYVILILICTLIGTYSVCCFVQG